MLPVPHIVFALCAAQMTLWQTAWSVDTVPPSVQPESIFLPGCAQQDAIASQASSVVSPAAVLLLHATMTMAVATIESEARAAPRSVSRFRMPRRKPRTAASRPLKSFVWLRLADEDDACDRDGSACERGDAKIAESLGRASRVEGRPFDRVHDLDEPDAAVRIERDARGPRAVGRAGDPARRDVDVLERCANGQGVESSSRTGRRSRRGSRTTTTRVDSRTESPPLANTTLPVGTLISASQAVVAARDNIKAEVSKERWVMADTLDCKRDAVRYLRVIQRNKRPV